MRHSGKLWYNRLQFIFWPGCMDRHWLCPQKEKTSLRFQNKQLQKLEESLGFKVTNYILSRIKFKSLTVFFFVCVYIY